MQSVTADAPMPGRYRGALPIGAPPILSVSEGNADPFARLDHGRNRGPAGLRDLAVGTVRSAPDLELDQGRGAGPDPLGLRGLWSSVDHGLRRDHAAAAEAVE